MDCEVMGASNSRQKSRRPQKASEIGGFRLSARLSGTDKIRTNLPYIIDIMGYTRGQSPDSWLFHPRRGRALAPPREGARSLDCPSVLFP